MVIHMMAATGVTIDDTAEFTAEVSTSGVRVSYSVNFPNVSGVAATASTVMGSSGRGI